MKQYILFLLLLFFFSFSNAQYQVIIIDEENSPNEPSIELNPYNTNEIVAGANINSYYYSHDGGISWIENALSSTYGVWGDPVIACDVNEDFYFFHLSNPVDGDWIDRIVCQKSEDGGETWNDGSYMGLNGTKEQDKEWVSIDRNNNNIYVTWTEFDNYGSTQIGDSSKIMFSMSDDGGATWTDALRINKTAGDCADDDHTVEGAVPAVGPNGEVYVAWAGRSAEGYLGIMFDKSYDFGETWLDEDIFAIDFPGGWVYDIPGIYRCNGLPVTKCDTSSGTYHGRIYVNWTDQENGSDDVDVWLIYSDDEGETWSEKKRVNDDPAGSHQFFTWMDIDQTNGNLYFIFYDRRNHSGNETDVYMAVSEDGGDSFENIMISETPFTPSASVFFGDYTNISVHSGKIAPIWARADGTQMSIRTIIPDESNIERINDLINTEVYPNPSEDIFYFSFKLKNTTEVQLDVISVFGQKITSIIDSKLYTYGKYVKSFQPAKYNLSSGVYFFRYSNGEKQIVKKIIYNK
jgi:hypothetical protein